MATIRCDETSVFVAVLLLCGAAAAVAVLRAALCAISALLCRLTGNRRRLPAVLEPVLCAAVFVASLVLSGDASGLLPWLLLLDALLSASSAWSSTSFRWIAVTGFLFLSVGFTHVVGPMLLVEEPESDGRREDWSALVRGQRLLLSAPTATRERDAASSTTGTSPSVPTLPHVYSYYDKVHIMGRTGPVAPSAEAQATLMPAAWRLLLLPALPSWAQAAVLPAAAATSNVSRDGRLSRSRRQANASASVVYLVAMGDDTRVSHYARHHQSTAAASADASVRDSVRLVGRRPALQHSDVSCLIARPLSSADNESEGGASLPSRRYTLRTELACVQLHESGTVSNLTVRWAYEAVPRRETDAESAAEDGNSTLNTSAAAAVPVAEPWRVVRVAAQADILCADALAGLRREVGDAVAERLLACVDDLDVATLPHAFVAKAPLLVWLGWQFPTYLHLVQDALAFWSTHALVPAWSFAAEALYLAAQATAVLGQHVGAWLVDTAPYARRAVEQVAVFAGGAVCGTASPDNVSPLLSSAAVDVLADVRARPRPTALMRPWGWRTALTRRCASFARSHAAHPAFRAGLSTRASTATLISGAADALDLVPGVWSVYAWAWRAEYRITVWILTALQAAAHFVICVAPKPAVHVVVAVVQWLAAAAPVLRVPFTHVWRLVLRLHVLTAAARVGRALWSLEKRAWACEVAVLKCLLGSVGAGCAAVLSTVAACAVTVGEWVAVLLRRYNSTSFSIHASVVLLQTALLLVAMRNEMNEYVAAELQLHKQRQQQRSLTDALVPGGGSSGGSLLTRYLPTRLMSRLPLSAFASRVNGFWMLVRAHHVACGRYVLLHAVAVLVLIGLSVLPFTSKLYALSLRYVVPWMSAQCFLVFFSPDPPPARRVALLVALRIAGTTLLQNTVGEFIYHILTDLLIAVGLMGGLALLLWAWPHRKELARQVATAITDSLHATPMPTPRRENRAESVGGRGGAGGAGGAGGVSTPSSTWRLAGLPLAPPRPSPAPAAVLNGDGEAPSPPSSPVLHDGTDDEEEEVRGGVDSGSDSRGSPSPRAAQHEEVEQHAASASRGASVTKQIDLSDAL